MRIEADCTAEEQRCLSTSKDICEFGSVRCSFSCFSVKTMEMWKYFQAALNGDDKNEDKMYSKIGPRS